jgi:uncharacterized membrane protein YhiD involved in acid resistance
LTTAACIWFIAAIGIIVGFGQYIPAIIGTIIGLAVLLGLDPVGHKMPSIKYSQITIVSDMDVISHEHEPTWRPVFSPA